jgi:hypothetical protein
LPESTCGDTSEKDAGARLQPDFIAIARPESIGPEDACRPMS